MHGTLNLRRTVLRVYEDETMNPKRQATYVVVTCGENAKFHPEIESGRREFHQILNNEFCPRKNLRTQSDILHPLEIYGISIYEYLEGNVVVVCENDKFIARDYFWEKA